MTRQKFAYLSALSASAVLFIGLLIGGGCANARRWAEPAPNPFLADILREDIPSDDDGIFCASIALAAVDARAVPDHAVIVRDPDNGRLKAYSFGYESMPLPPGDMMQTVTYAWLLDKKLGTMDNFFDSYNFINDLSKYLGSSRVFYMPRYHYHSLLESEFASILDGRGILLSQDQLLTFYGSIARNGVRPDKAWYRRQRICSAQTAGAVSALLREEVLSGKDTALTRLAIPVAGRSGTGILDKGWIPYRQIQPSDPVQAASFVGFFPSYAPKYTLCVSVYSSDAPRTETAVRIFEDIVNRLDKEGKL